MSGQFNFKLRPLKGFKQNFTLRVYYKGRFNTKLEQYRCNSCNKFLSPHKCEVKTYPGILNCYHCGAPLWQKKTL